jgi:hypothetical protein
MDAAIGGAITVESIDEALGSAIALLDTIKRIRCPCLDAGLPYSTP